MYYRIVASDPSGGFDKRQLLLKQVEYYEDALAWRPNTNTRRRLARMGYDRLELCPKGHADSAAGYAPFAVCMLARP